MIALQLDAILFIALVIATVGLAVTRVFAHLDRSVLITFTGSRGRLILIRLTLYFSAALASIGVCGMLFLILPGFIAMGTFFGFEAVVLDICSQRIEFVREPDMVLVRTPIRSSRQRPMTGAF